MLARGETRLEAELLEAAAHPLKAPAVGRMARTIHEHVRCTVRYRFYQGGHLCFDRTSRRPVLKRTDWSPPLLSDKRCNRFPFVVY